jgi:hypothetical protein
MRVSPRENFRRALAGHPLAMQRQNNARANKRRQQGRPRRRRPATPRRRNAWAASPTPLEGARGARARDDARPAEHQGGITAMATTARTAKDGHRDGHDVDGRPRRAGETQILALGRLWKARGGRGRTEDPPPGSITTKLPSRGATAMAASGEPGRCSPGPGTAGDDRDDPPLDHRRQGEGHGATRAPGTTEFSLGTTGPGKDFNFGN